MYSVTLLRYQFQIARIKYRQTSKIKSAKRQRRFATDFFLAFRTDIGIVVDMPFH